MKHFCKVCGKPTHYALTRPKFCAECGQPVNPNDPKGWDLKHSDKTYPNPNQDFQNKVVEQNTILPNQFKVKFQNDENTNFRASGRDSILENESVEVTDDIDSEDYDISRLEGVKPKFTIQTFANNSQSLENVLTQGYAANAAPPERVIPVNNDVLTPTSTQDILAEFAREAGASRQK
jgi:hypothetical protein